MGSRSGDSSLAAVFERMSGLNSFVSMRYALHRRRRRGVHLTLGQVLHLSYMLKNEPFEKLPVAYRPVQRRGHYPPRLSLGFAIRKEVAEFRRVALKEELADAWEINHTMCFFELTALVLGHLNKLCGLPPKQGMTSKWIHSREGIAVIELESNYDWWIPEEKLDDAIGVIREHFNLPSDAKPRWYLENDVDLKEPDEYLLPSESYISYDDAAKPLTTFCSVSF